MIGGEAVDGHDLDRVTQAAFAMGVGGARVQPVRVDVARTRAPKAPVVAGFTVEWCCMGVSLVAGRA